MSEEVMEMIDERVKELLEEAEKYEAKSDMRRAIMQEVYKLLELYHNATELNFDYFDKEKRREIDEKRNETMARIEEEKNKVPVVRVVLETGKVVVPLATSVLMLYGYFKAQNKVFDFEEHGSITSSAGRQLGLPRVFKF